MCACVCVSQVAPKSVHESVVPLLKEAGARVPRGCLLRRVYFDPATDEQVRLWHACVGIVADLASLAKAMYQKHAWLYESAATIHRFCPYKCMCTQHWSASIAHVLLHYRVS